MTEPIRCPSCGSDDLTFRYDAVIAIWVLAGEVRFASVDGVLDDLPDGAECANQCLAIADEATSPSELRGAGADLVDRALPDVIRTALTKGFTVYQVRPDPAGVVFEART